MKLIALQISPEAKTAYFADYIQVALAELSQVCAVAPIEQLKFGALEFFVLEQGELELESLSRLSFVQGVYEFDGEQLRPLDISAAFRLHEAFVFGSKFKGKTNERLTQMLINVGLEAIGSQTGEGVKLLDPMCGRATTLLWAIRYGINARGIEQDAGALVDIHRNLKKWTKLHRQKHKLSDGFIGAANKAKRGKFLDFSAEEKNMRVVVGDAISADQIFKKEKFDLLVSDLPYGVQHFTTEQTRSPMAVIEQCTASWKSCLKKNGAVVLSFNSNNPRRSALVAVFEREGFVTLPFSAAHRMSESIVRDVVIFKRAM